MPLSIDGLQPFPFIVGCSRSGKSLLKAMLDAHPEMSVAMETHFVAGVARRRRLYQGSDGFRKEMFLRDLLAGPALADLGLDQDEVRAWAASGRMADCASAVRELFAIHSRRRGKTRYGNRTAIHVLSMSWIASLLPEARFIHLVRDGRDMALALVDARFGPSTVGHAAMRWRLRTGRGRRDGEILGPDRYREIRYEDLVADPEPVLRSVCDFVRLDFHPRMLRYYEHAPEIGGVSLDDPDFRDLRLPPTVGLRDWRTEMSRDDVLLFESIAGRTLIEFGYPLSAEHWTLRERLRSRAKAWAHRAGAIGARARRAGRTLFRHP